MAKWNVFTECSRLTITCASVAQSAARESHNLEVVSSNLTRGRRRLVLSIVGYGSYSVCMCSIVIVGRRCRAVKATDSELVSNVALILLVIPSKMLSRSTNVSTQDRTEDLQRVRPT